MPRLASRASRPHRTAASPPGLALMTPAAGQWPDVCLSAWALCCMLLAGAEARPGGQSVGHSPGSERVDGLVKEVHRQLRTWPRSRRGADACGILQDLVIGQPHDSELRGRPRSSQPGVSHHRSKHSQQRALPDMHDPVRSSQLTPRPLRQPRRPFERACRDMGVGPTGQVLFGLLAQRHHHGPGRPSYQPFPPHTLHHAATDTPHLRAPHRPDLFSARPSRTSPWMQGAGDRETRGPLVRRWAAQQVRGGVPPRWPAL